MALATVVTSGPIPGTLEDLAKLLPVEDTVLELATLLPGGVDHATVAWTPLVAATAFLDPVLLPDALLLTRALLVAGVGFVDVDVSGAATSSDEGVDKAFGLVTVEGAVSIQITTDEVGSLDDEAADDDVTVATGQSTLPLGNTVSSASSSVWTLGYDGFRVILCIFLWKPLPFRTCAILVKSTT